MIRVRCELADRNALESLSIDPASLADDGSDYVCIRVEKPWGHEIEKYRDKKVSLWRLHIHAQHETSMHCHPHKTTLLMVEGGSGILRTLNGSHELAVGQLIVIEPGAFHRTQAGADDLWLWESESPSNKQDLVRLEDSYGRGQGYERI